MRPRDIKRALAHALLAAVVSLAGSGARALASSPDRLEDVARDGHEAPSQIARAETGAVRLAPRTRTALDDGGGRQLVAALASRVRAAVALGERFVLEAVPRGNPRPFSSTLRTSRGPPQG